MIRDIVRIDLTVVEGKNKVRRDRIRGENTFEANRVSLTEVLNLRLSGIPDFDVIYTVGGLGLVQ